MKQTDYGSIRALQSPINPPHSPASEKTQGSSEEGTEPGDSHLFPSEQSGPQWSPLPGGMGCVQEAACVPKGGHSRGRG